MLPRHLLVAACLLSLPAPAGAAVFGPGDVFAAPFDASGLPPPYDAAIISIDFADTNFLDAGEDMGIELFDSGDMLVAATTFQEAFGPSSVIGFSTPLPIPVGYADPFGSIRLASLGASEYEVVSAVLIFTKADITDFVRLELVDDLRYIPLPASAFLLLGGIGTLFGIARRRQRR